jgi:hypothetical protein
MEQINLGRMIGAGLLAGLILKEMIALLERSHAGSSHLALSGHPHSANDCVDL